MAAAPDPDRPLDVPPGATCSSCRYDLRGLTEPRCPECGTAFSLRQLWAEHRGAVVKRPFDAAAARSLRQPTAWAITAAGLGVAFEWSRGLPARIGDPPSMVAVGAVLWAAGAWGMRLAERQRTFARVDVPPAAARRRGWTWIGVPLAVALAVACLFESSWARVWIAFELSRSRLDGLAAAVETSRADAPDQQVGRFPAAAIRPTADGMNFRVNGLYEARLAHTTTGRPPVRWPAASPLRGGWYAVWLGD